MPCPAYVDFSEQPIQKASLATSRHSLSFTLRRHPSGNQNAVFSHKSRVTKVHKAQHSPAQSHLSSLVAISCSQEPGQLGTVQCISGASGDGALA